MTQVLEAIVVAIAFDKDEDACPFSHDPAKKGPDTPNDWTYDSTKLGDNVAKGKKTYLPHLETGKVWVESKKGSKDGKPSKVTYNAHHVLPVRDCWKKTKLKRWIDHKEEKLVEHDIGYDVNGSENGIDLPSSKAMHSAGWTGKGPDFQRKYAFAAIDATIPIRQFHDSHKPYSAFATKVLDKIAEKLNDKEEKGQLKCKHDKCNPGKKKPYKTPVHLLPRIYAAAARLAKHLSGGPSHWKTPIMTSKFSLMYKKRKLTADQAREELSEAQDELEKK